MNARKVFLDAPPAALLERWQTGLDLLAELGNVPAVTIGRFVDNQVEVALVSRGGERWLAVGNSAEIGAGTYCELVLHRDEAVHVRDARENPALANAIRLTGGMISYLGFPLHWPDGELFGTLVALDLVANDFAGLFRRQIEQVVRAVEAELAVLDENTRLHREIAAHRETERALRATERLHNEAQRIAGLGHWHHDLLTNELAWSDELFRLYEIDKAQFVPSYQAFLDLVHPEDRRQLHEAFNRSIGERRPFSINYRLLMHDGRIKWLSARAATTYSPDGLPLYSTGTTQDVTARMEAELALQESEARHRQAQSVANLGHWQLDLVTGELSWSDQLFEIFEVDRTRFPASYDHFLQLVHPDERVALDEAYARSVAERTDYSFLHRLLMPDGRIKWVLESGITRYADDGTPLVSVGTAQDITTRKEAARERDTLARIVSELREMIFIADLDGNVIYINESCRRLIAPGGLDLPVHALEILVPEEHALFTGEILPRLLAGGTWQGEHTYRVFGSDRRVQARVEAFGIRDDVSGKISHLVNVSLDLAEHKAAEHKRAELENRLLHAQKLESLGLMAGGIAHDFNNILQAVIGNLELIDCASDADPAARAALDRARQGALRAAEITSQLLTFAGRDIQPKQQVDLGRLVEEGVQLMRAVVDKRINLRVSPPAGALQVQGVPGQIQQVLVNLVTNAAEAISDGNGEITVSCGQLAQGDPELARIRESSPLADTACAVLEVRDTGRGMDAETQARLFDPFFTSKQHGRGLGMPSVLGIVRAHDGAVVVESRPGQGTRARVLVPLADDQTPPVVTPSSAPVMATLKGHVLLVDDDESIRIVGAALLKRRGFRVTTAATGTDAIALLGSEGSRYECVILDLTMPGIDGAGVFRFLRERHPVLPVLLASGFDHAEALRRIPASPHTAFIRKPWRGDQLFAAIGSLLNRTV